MTALLGLWRRRYGASPVHLVLHLVTFAIALFALHRVIVAGRPINFIAWFVGAALLHDLVLLPLYSLLDHAAGRGVRLARLQRRGVPIINHLRAPALIAAVLLLVYLPEISGKSEHTYANVSGRPLRPYLLYWVLFSAALFLGSALVYAVRVLRTAPPAASAPPSAE